MSFVNTKDIMGEQAAFDALVAHTLTEFNDDSISQLGTYALYKQANLVSVNFPSLTSIDTSAFDGCSNIETIDIGSRCSIGSGVFKNCPKLTALILRGTSSASSFQGDSLTGTNFALLKGGIYVPQTLVSTYRGLSNLAKYKAVIRSIEDMPVTDFSTIDMTWAQLKAAVDDESFFSSAYAVGDIKQFTYSDGTTSHTVHAEIRKIDSTNKFVDFVIKNFDETIKMNNSSTMVLYANSLLKARLDAIYADELPSDLKAAISPVAKKYYAYDGTTEEIIASIWALNTKDAGLTGSYLKDSEGEDYFLTNSDRIKYNQQTGSSADWWLGSAQTSSSFVLVNNTGSGGNIYPNNTYGFVFGFRIKKASS